VALPTDMVSYIVISALWLKMARDRQANRISVSTTVQTISITVWQHPKGKSGIVAEALAEQKVPNTMILLKISVQPV
jgi:hypothetical protein